MRSQIHHNNPIFLHISHFAYVYKLFSSELLLHYIKTTEPD